MGSLIVTVDGPSGTGKSTVARAAAERSGLPHLDTGAFYRAATLAALRAGVDVSDESGVVELLSSIDLGQEQGRMLLGGEDVSEEIRGEAVTASVSKVAAHPRVRQLLVGHQRDWVDSHGRQAVVEGRDIGSVVFPDAELKIYLDARPEVRAARRAAQDGEDLEEVLEDILRRDRIDSTREASPLVVPDGANVVDTSDLSFEEVVDSVVRLINAKF